MLLRKQCAGISLTLAEASLGVSWVDRRTNKRNCAQNAEGETFVHLHPPRRMGKTK